MVGLCALCYIAIVGHAAATHLRTRAHVLDGAMLDGAEYSSAPCARRAALRGGRAGGPSRAPLCAAFTDGAANTNACPSGSSKIVSEAVCAIAAGALGRSWGGIHFTFENRPSGCYTATGSSVFFNDHPTGAPHPDHQPLCAGKP